MPTYRVKQELTQVVVQRYWEEFDTSDQAAWDELRKRVDPSGLQLEDYPIDAPTDPNLWFDLYQSLYYAEYANQEEDDWVSDLNGTTEHNFVLEDSDGNAVS